jgi:L-threonylcarbamoyladenylate synthase
MMDTRILTVDQTAQAGEILRRGGLVAIPTETVYGLAASVFDERAVANIYTAKGRPSDNPLIVHLSDGKEMEKCCLDIPEESWLLAKTFWPGPLSMVLTKRPEIPAIVSGGLDSVAVRVPAHPVARAVIAAAGVPLAAPSANLSGSPSPTKAEHVIHDLSGRIDAVIDGGPCQVGVESTVIDMRTKPFRLLRPGGVSKERLEAVLGEIEVDSAVSGSLTKEQAPASPGMKYRHYAPNAPVLAVCGPGEASARYISREIRENDGVICYSGQEMIFSKAKAVIGYGEETDDAALARNIFDVLRQMDLLSPERIFIQCPNDRALGFAVANRIKKAAGFHVISAPTEEIL